MFWGRYGNSLGVWGVALLEIVREREGEGFGV